MLDAYVILFDEGSNACVHCDVKLTDSCHNGIVVKEFYYLCMWMSVVVFGDF